MSTTGTSATLAPRPTRPARPAALRVPAIPARMRPTIAAAVLLVAMWIVGSFRYDSFATPSNFSNVLLAQAPLIVLAVGMTFVILTGGIDLSVGAMVALASMLVAKGVMAGLPIPAVFLGVLVFGTLFGLAQGAIIHHFGVQPFIVTLAGMFLARGATFIIDRYSVAIDNDAFKSFAGARFTLGGFKFSWGMIVALLVVAAGMFVLHLTRFGRTVYALGDSETSARLMGLEASRTKIQVYAVSGFCASLGGILFAMHMRTGFGQFGIAWELFAIASVVIGGTLLTGGVGYVIGSFVGVLVYGTIHNMITNEGTLNAAWTSIAIGVLVLAFIVLQRLLVRRSPT